MTRSGDTWAANAGTGEREDVTTGHGVGAERDVEGGPTMNYWLFSAIGLVVTLVIVVVLVAIIENERW